MAKPYDPKDFYYRKAKKAGLRARSAFKIDEILRRHRLLRKGQAVLDLGAAPGGFLQILADEVGETGVAVGVDLERIAPSRSRGSRRPSWTCSRRTRSTRSARCTGQFQLVASDMAPKTIGIKITDEARSLELDPDGTRGRGADARAGAFVAKVFMGGEFPALKKARGALRRGASSARRRCASRATRCTCSGRASAARGSGAGRAGRRGEDGSFAGRLGRSGHDRDAGRDGHPGDAGAPGGLDAARRSAPEEAAGPYRRVGQREAGASCGGEEAVHRRKGKAGEARRRR